jgi:hypothetical protein
VHTIMSFVTLIILDDIRHAPALTVSPFRSPFINSLRLGAVDRGEGLNTRGCDNYFNDSQTIVYLALSAVGKERI